MSSTSKKKPLVLILGAGGLLGRIIYEKLDKNYRIIGTSHRKNTNTKIIKVNYKRINDKFLKLIKNSDIIINCIGENRIDRRMLEINYKILKNISSKIKDKNTKKIFIHISTCGVYGETKSEKISELTNPEPRTLYSKTKLLGEQILRENLKDKRKLIILRCSQIVGYGMRNTSIKKLFYYIKKNLFFFIDNKKAIFSYIFSDDVISCIKKLIKKKNLNYSIFNLSSKSTFEDLVQEITISINKKTFIPNINPIFVNFFVIFFENILKINSPISKKQLSSLMLKKIYVSKKIQKKTNFYKFLKINRNNLNKLINE